MKKRMIKTAALILTLTFCLGASVMAKTSPSGKEPTDTNKVPTSPQTSASVTAMVSLAGLSAATIVAGLHKKED